jgi:hypothetical protein
MTIRWGSVLLLALLPRTLTEQLTQLKGGVDLTLTGRTLHDVVRSSANGGGSGVAVGLRFRQDLTQIPVMQLGTMRWGDGPSQLG